MIFPKIRLSSLRKTLLFLLVIGISFTAGYFAATSGLSITKNGKVNISREIPQGREDLDFALFWRVWDTLESDYLLKEKLDPANMVYGAIKGMVAAVGDPYTVFLSPTENKVVQEDLSGTFEGVGIQLGFKGSRLAVIAPLPGSPAEKAGVMAGDFIVGIKDEKKEIDTGTVGMTLQEAVGLIRGPAGDVVTLTLIRDGSEEPVVVDIIRASIENPSVKVDYVGEGESIAHIRVLKFSSETAAEWEEAIREVLLKKEVTSVILDVRNNPGGYLQAAVDVASEFLENGDVVVIEETSGGEKQEFRVERLGRMKETPVIVLINQGSASASEILAGALRDVDKTRLVGETSFGKGTIQEPRQINGGSALHITTARWLTPSGFWVDEGGLTPDVEIDDNPETEEDEQLTRAIELLN